MRYEVTRRAPIVRALCDAVERSGGRASREVDPTKAPFQIELRTMAGEQISVLAYAFLANRYRQGNRPTGEHRFQVKYGADFHHPHHIFIDGSRRLVTLMLGVHLEEGIFVAVDPAMHEPTWFSRSVEFKEARVREVQATSWSGWERERSLVRRKIDMPQASFQTEVLLGLTPDRFLDYVGLERAATGLDPGERLLLIDELRNRPRRGERHPLELELGLSSAEILDIASNSFRLHAALRGHTAEHYLGRHLRSVFGERAVERLDKDGQPDFSAALGRKRVRIECKNVLRETNRHGIARVDFQKTRASKGDPCSRSYSTQSFDVLAACLHPVSKAWEFRFCPTRLLKPHRRCPESLDDRVLVDGDHWSSDVRTALGG